MNINGSRVICQIGSKRYLLMATSGFLACNIGFPQGSVLSPVLFLILINDLLTAVQHSFINIFADDTSIYGGEQDRDNLEVLLQNDITNISNLVLGKQAQCKYWRGRCNKGWVETKLIPHEILSSK